MSYTKKYIMFFTHIWDVDALAFINSTGITNSIIKGAINEMVIALKNNSLWTLFNAIYPFVGGTATTHKYNLKNPLDINSAFRLSFAATGVTHDSNGVTFDGITGFANTFLTPSVTLILNDESMCLYSRTSGASPTANETDMGAAVSTTQRDTMNIRNSVDTSGIVLNSTTAGSGTSSFTNTDGRGLFHGSRISSTNLQMYKNGVSQNTASTTNNGTRSNIAIYIGGRNVANTLSFPVSRNYAFCGIGKGFNSTQAALLYQIVQEFQTRLGRQV